MVPKSVIRRLGSVLVMLGPATSFAISPSFSFDPINPIKVAVLVSISFLGFGLVLPYFKSVIFRAGKLLPLIISMFLLGMTSSFFLSGADFSQQFWGVFGRNTGVLTYLALAVTLFLVAIIRDKEIYKRLLFGLFFTTIFMIGYCLLQIAGLDPVNWSAFFPFGTLGNVNFLSGFLGLSLVPVFIFLVSSSINVRKRFGLASVLVIGFFVLVKSDSTQGFVAFTIGASTFLLVLLWTKSKPGFLVFLVTYVGGVLSLILALLNRGPLRELIYQFTVVYRADYMHAGWKMMIDNPLTGVGIDAYDDWYRAERGVISAYRTGFNRTANSAHNIVLDLGAGGGFPLFLAYLILNLLILLLIGRGLRRGLFRDPVFLAISMSWFAYQVQAAVSINQVGVGVWGWILGGAAIGYVKSDEADSLTDSTFPIKGQGISKNNPKGVRRVNSKSKLIPPPPIAVISSFLFFSIGFLLAFLPLKADSDYVSASRKGSAQAFIDYSRSPAVNSFLLSRSLELANKSGLQPISDELLSTLKNKFPRNLFGQLVTIEIPTASPSAKAAAKLQVGKIDPYLAFCFEPDPIMWHLRELAKLPPKSSYEIAKGWGLLENSDLSVPENFRWEKVDQEKLRNRLNIFCAP